MKKLLLSGLMVLSTAQAATIAVIDSGLDVRARTDCSQSLGSTSRHFNHLFLKMYSRVEFC